MNIEIRAYRANDVAQMTELLNEIIGIGGTTAYLVPITHSELTEKITLGVKKTCWTVAIDETGRLVGFQWAEPHDQLPADAASIATFVRVGVVGGGIGTKLFEATKQKQRAFGTVWINASIRSDNESGLRYYAKMGFENWKIDPEATLSDGRVVGKTHKRFDL